MTETIANTFEPSALLPVIEQESQRALWDSIVYFLAIAQNECRWPHVTLKYVFAQVFIGMSHLDG